MATPTTEINSPPAAADPTSPVAATVDPAALAADALAPLAESHRAAWVALARSHAALIGRLQEALSDADLPPYQWFELLALLEAADEGRLKMGEVAEALIMTRGGLTKLFDRLEAAGLVARRSCPTDRRAVFAVIEKPGRKLLAQMRPIVSAELESSFVQRISAAEAQTISEALERARVGACSMDGEC